MADKNRKNVQQYLQEKKSSKGKDSSNWNVEKQNRQEDNSSRGTRNAERGSRGAQYGAKGAKSSETNGWSASTQGAEEPAVKWQKSTFQDWAKKSRNDKD